MEIYLIHLTSINWEAVSAIGQVTGAFATLLAVYVALFQINKTTKPQINIEITNAIPVSQDGILLNQHFNFKIINKGVIAVKVTNFFILLPDNKNLTFFGFSPFLLNPMDTQDNLQSVSEIIRLLREQGYTDKCKVKICYEIGSGVKIHKNKTIDLRS